MKNIVIIEDNYSHFKSLKKHLSSRYNCYPNFITDDDFFNFRGNIAKSFSGGNKEAEARSYINSILKRIDNIDLFVIDLQLKEDDSSFNVNGKFFYDFFVKNNPDITQKVPVLFITAVNSRTQRNSLNDYVENINKEKVNRFNLASFIEKEDGWENDNFTNFNQKLNQKISELLNNFDINIDNLP